MEIIIPTQKNLETIVKHLKNGKILICPTDTVYGFICDAGNEKSVEKIFEIKKRDKLKPLGIFVKNIEAAKKFAIVDKNQGEFLKDNKTTVILKSRLRQGFGGQAKNKTLSKLVYKNGTIGIRIPKCELLNLILDKFRKPVAQTSANLSGKEATTKIKDIIEQFKNEDVIIIDGGDLPDSKPSKIVELTNDKINILRK